MSATFYLDPRADKKGENPIFVSIYINGVRLQTSIGMKLEKSKWDKEKMKPRRGVSNKSGLTWSEIISKMNEIEEHFKAIERDVLKGEIEVTPEFIKQEFQRAFRRNGKPQDNGPSFWDYYQMFVKERGDTNNWTRATVQKFNALENHLRDWRGEEELKFDDFDEDGLNGLVKFLREELDMKNSTIGKQLGFLKWFLRWATLKGYNTTTAFQSFSPKLKMAQKKVVFLSWEELMKVLQYEIPPSGTVVKLKNHDGDEYEKIVMHSDGMEKAKDVFCFCCFTSLRFSDANNLKRSDIHNGKMTLTTIKTADTITIELNKYAESILKKYKKSDFGGYALPRITNQRMNLYVKELCELCGINEPVTMTYYKGNERIEDTLPKYELIGTHTGRRTFICNALMLGIPAEIVMKWTGHADYKSMKPYIDVTNQAKVQAMDLFNKL